MTMTSGTATTGTLWNGPICGTCGTGYLGNHTCSHEDIVRRINQLMELLKPGPVQRNGLDMDRTAGCPCRPENGGSGVCGCILGGMQTTC